MEQKTKDRGSATTAIFNAVAILEFLCAADAPQTLTQLSRHLGIAKASMFRNLNALEQCGYVVRDLDDGGYSIGPRILGLARKFSQTDRIVAAARPHLVELAKLTNETAHVAVLTGTDIIYLDVVEGSQLVRAVVQPGDRLPAHCVASGKAILAFSAEETLKTIIDTGLPRFTSSTLVSEKSLRQDLLAIRDRGYATNVGEWVEDVGAAAAPVLSIDGTAIAAIGIAGPKTRLNARALETLSKHIRQQADAVSDAIGASRRNSIRPVALVPNAPAPNPGVRNKKP